MRYARIWLKSAGPGALQHRFESDDLAITVNGPELVYSYGTVHGRARLEHVLFWETGEYTPEPIVIPDPPLPKVNRAWFGLFG